MGLVFFCLSCGARFEVEPRMAGKKGRCKKCGQPMEIPRPEHVASLAAVPALAPAAAGAGPAGNWLRSASSDVGLAPVTLDRMPIGMRRGAAPSPLDDAEDSKPYVLAVPVTNDVHRGSSGRPNVVAQAWRNQLGNVQTIFRKLNQFAYLISIPFLMGLLLGTAVRSRPLALTCATVVVLLNLGRIATGLVNLILVPLRDGLNTKKLKKPFRRVAEPALTIGLVVLAFAYIPWLRTGGAAEGTATQRLRSSARDLRGEMKGKLRTTVGDVEGLDVGKLGEQAQERLKSIATSAGPGETPGTPGDAGATVKDKVGGALKDVSERVRETIKGSEKQP